MSSTLLFVGIDVAKAECVVAVRPTGATWTVPQTEAGWTTLAARLQGLAPTLVLLEATGGLELPVTSVLAAAVRRDVGSKTLSSTSRMGIRDVAMYSTL